MFVIFGAVSARRRQRRPLGGRLMQELNVGEVLKIRIDLCVCVRCGAALLGCWEIVIESRWPV